MPLATTRRGAASAAVAKQVAAAQRWRCRACDQLLPAAFEIDHSTPLWAGGADSLANLQALCPNCHATKTQTEAISRRLEAERTDKHAAYDDRNDVVVAPGVFRCDECLQRRPIGRPHPVCWVIERRFSPPSTDRAKTALLRFAFTPRANAGDTRRADRLQQRVVAPFPDRAVVRGGVHAAG